MSAADQDRIIGAPAGGRRAIASKAVSTGVKSISCVPSSLILSSNSGSRTKECCLKKGEISISADLTDYSSSVRWYNANSSIWRIEPLGTVIHKVWLGKLMHVAVSCWWYVWVARAGMLTSHRFPMISACVVSTWERGVASAGQLVSGLMDSKPQMPSVLSRTKGLFGQRKRMSLVRLHIFRFGARYNCSLLSWYAATLGVWILT